MSSNNHETFVLKPLQSEIQCAIISDPSGRITVVYEGELASEIQWVEFDPVSKDLSIVHEDGKTQDLGIPLNNDNCANIAHGSEVSFIRLLNGKAISMSQVVFLLKDY